MPILNAIMGSPILSKIGSTENGTVHGGDFLAAIKNRLYLCNALLSKYSLTGSSVFPFWEPTEDSTTFCSVLYCLFLFQSSTRLVNKSFSNEVVLLSKKRCIFTVSMIKS